MGVEQLTDETGMGMNRVKAKISSILDLKESGIEDLLLEFQESSRKRGEQVNRESGEVVQVSNIKPTASPSV